jgi:hypothetical protein
MIALPTLDNNTGNNGLATGINDFGEVAGAAENTTPGCPTQNPAASLNQYYQYRPVLWRNRAIDELATVGGDLVGTALAINDQGEAAGITGTCGAFNFLSGGYYMNPLHAVLWEKDGTPTNLGSLGGNEHSLAGTGAKDLNSWGHVVGFSSLSDNVTFNGFLWTRETGKMKALVPIKGVANSLAVALNDSDVVVGSSINSTFTTLTATIWTNGVPTDLNTLIPDNSSLYLLFGCSINSRGEILGLATNLAGTVYHAYELIPIGK